MEPAKHVIEALSRVMADLPGIPRGDQSEQGYSYRGIESITRHLQPLLAKHGVVFVPHVERREVVALTINNRPWTQDELWIRYEVYGPGGVDDHITVGPLVGLGRDNSDKGSNKATTQAYKYALIQTLCIGDAKDDADHEVAHEADEQPVNVTVAAAKQRLVAAVREAGATAGEDEAAAKARSEARAAELWAAAGLDGSRWVSPAELTLVLGMAAQIRSETPAVPEVPDAALEPSEALTGAPGPVPDDPGSKAEQNDGLRLRIAETMARLPEDEQLDGYADFVAEWERAPADLAVGKLEKALVWAEDYVLAVSGAEGAA